MQEAEPPVGAGTGGRRADPRGYWRANLRLIGALLVVWASVSYGCGILLVEPLNRIHLGGFPLGFWFAQQGAIYVFVLLILVYAVSMDRIDRRYGVDGERSDRGDEPGPDTGDAP